MDFELDGQSIGLTFLFWAIVMAMLWGFMPNKESVPILTRVIISIISIPAIFLMVKFQTR